MGTDEWYSVSFVEKCTIDEARNCTRVLYSDVREYYPVWKGNTLVLTPRPNCDVPTVVVDFVQDDEGKKQHITVKVSPKRYGVKTYNEFRKKLRKGLKEQARGKKKLETVSARTVPERTEIETADGVDVNVHNIANMFKPRSRRNSADTVADSRQEELSAQRSEFPQGDAPASAEPTATQETVEIVPNSGMPVVRAMRHVKDAYAAYVPLRVITIMLIVSLLVISLLTYGFVARGNTIDQLNQTVANRDETIAELSNEKDSLQASLDAVEPQRKANEAEDKRLQELSDQLQSQKTQQDQKQQEQDQRQSDLDTRQSELDAREQSLAAREQAVAQSEAQSYYGSSSTGSSSSGGSAYYKNCAAARAAGAAPLYRGDPGYRSKLDADGDGIACE
ncbi:excalibur calcium-binding domain-containing protein [Bifidobacterium phasiani]|uniref:excalibur calcium-binding domain-containing protein n=1 Tax=Bifidobacterium phasiani TaxID=2834431 RepID=UPI001F4026D1|nr:excalibur calcium-binding domain-containing protein [Bifidobacterium phasiani]